MSSVIMTGILAILAGLLILVGAITWYGAIRRRRVTANHIAALIEAPRQHPPPEETVPAPSSLPAPVERYLRHALPSTEPRVLLASLRQEGTLKSSPRATKWVDFHARQVVSPPGRQFLWDARVNLAPLVHVRVRDSYDKGRGSAAVHLWSGLRLSHEEDHRRLNTSALHRYLAEAVWYPTALLPSEGVEWTPHSDTQAIATLTDGELRVSATFNFNEDNEITRVSTTGRFGRFGNRYFSKPWEGRFSNYTDHQGFRVPLEAEADWHFAGEWHTVWRGRVTQLAYELDPIGYACLQVQEEDRDHETGLQTA